MTAPPIHDRRPADRFYWAILDASMLPQASLLSRRRLEAQLGFLFESVLPGLPIEHVHAVYHKARGGGRRYVACGLPRSQLRETVPPETLTLGPESLPPFIEADVDAARINLLTAEHAPPALRRLRGRWLGHAGALAAAAMMLLSTGFERRAQSVRAGIERVAVARAAVYRDVLGPDALRSAQPPDLQLMAEMRRLQQTRSADTSLVGHSDASVILANLLSRWPGDVPVQVRTLEIAAERIRIVAAVRELGDVTRLSAVLGSVPGWRLDHPATSTAAGRVDVTFVLRRSAAEAGAGAGGGGDGA